MSAQPHNTAVQPLALELFVLQHRGQEVNHSWSWPADGPPAPNSLMQTGMDTVLADVPGLDAATLAQASLCTLQRMGTPAQPVWMVGNSGHSLACSLNGTVLAAGSQMRLDHGDVIELGLTSLLVSLEPSQGMPELPDWEVTQPGHSPAAISAFALTDLDAIPDSTQLADAPHHGLKRLDIGDLISLEPDTNIPAMDTDPVDAPIARLAPIKSAGRPVPQPAPTDDLLDVLHARYLDKLRNPSKADADDAWQDLVRGAQAQQQDPVQQWMQAAGSSPGLDDLLGQQHSIASVIEGLDALGGIDVLAPEPFDSVMHLFAPEHLRAPEQASLQSLVQHSLPGLTQREHHSMSVDSAMPFTGGEEPPRTSH